MDEDFQTPEHHELESVRIVSSPPRTKRKRKPFRVARHVKAHVSPLTAILHGFSGTVATLIGNLSEDIACAGYNEAIHFCSASLGDKNIIVCAPSKSQTFRGYSVAVLVELVRKQGYGRGRFAFVRFTAENSHDSNRSLGQNNVISSCSC